MTRFLPVALLGLALALLFPESRPALAQAPPSLPSIESQASQEAERHQVELVRFAVDYTKSIVTGMLIGGMTMSVMVGGGGPTLVGAVIGSLAGGWWHFHVLARSRPAGHWAAERSLPHASLEGCSTPLQTSKSFIGGALRTPPNLEILHWRGAPHPSKPPWPGPEPVLDLPDLEFVEQACVSWEEKRG
jgi:hypothetical protein